MRLRLLPARPLLLALAVAGALGAGACREEGFSPEEERLHAKLKAAASAPSGTIPREVAQAQLAERATAEAPERSLPVPPDARAQAGAVQLKLRTLVLAQAVSAGRVRLTAQEPFLRVGLLAHNAGTSALPLPLGGAVVQGADGQRYPVARDAQQVAGVRELDAPLSPGQEREVALYFNLPEAALAPGAALVLPGGSGPEVRLALQ